MSYEYFRIDKRVMANKSRFIGEDSAHILCGNLDSLAIGIKKMPAMEIAGLCLPLKPQKERSLHDVFMNIFLICLLEKLLKIKSWYCRRAAGSSTDFCGDQHFHVQMVSASKNAVSFGYLVWLRTDSFHN